MFPFFIALYNGSQVSIVALWATCIKNMATPSHDTLKCLVLGVFIPFPSSNPCHTDAVTILELKNKDSQRDYYGLRRGFIEVAAVCDIMSTVWDVIHT